MTVKEMFPSPYGDKLQYCFGGKALSGVCVSVPLRG